MIAGKVPRSSSLCWLQICLLLLSIGLAGCAAFRHEERPTIPRGPAVAEISFEGNLTFEDQELAAVIALTPTSSLMFWERKYLDYGALETDRDRLETFYRMLGFLDVDVSPFQLLPNAVGLKALLKSEVPPTDATLSLKEPIPGPALSLEDGQLPGEQPFLRDFMEGSPEQWLVDPAAGGIPLESWSTRSNVLTREEAGRGLTSIRIIIKINEGVRYAVQSLRIALKTPLSRQTFAQLQGVLTVEEGSPFDLDKVATDVESLRDTLWRAGRAWARVQEEVLVLPEAKQVRVRYVIDPGPPCTFGQIHIKGLSTVEEALVRERAVAAIEAGAVYNPAPLAKLQAQLYELQLFQSVLVQLDETSQAASEVDVLISLTERPFRLMKAAGGFTQDNEWQELYLSSGWSHNYVRNRLIRLNLSGRFGWAFTPNFLAVSQIGASQVEEGTIVRNGPVTDLKANLTLPEVFATRVNLNASLRFLIGQTKTYGFMSPQFRLSGARTLFSNLTTQIGIGIEQYLPTWDEASQAVFAQDDQVSLGKDDIRFQGRLTFLEQKILYDRRDNVLATTRGVYAAVYLQEAGILGDFSFLKFLPEARVYFPRWGDRLVIAGRLSNGVIVPLGGGGAPAVLKFRTGGGSTLRGFDHEELTWYTGVDCQEARPNSNSDSACDVETGGNILRLMNLESRFYLNAVGVAAFVDAGQISVGNRATVADLFQWRQDNWQATVGFGFRYRTLIGPIRLDLGRPVLDPLGRASGLYILGKKLCLCALHLAIGEAF